MLGIDETRRGRGRRRWTKNDDGSWSRLERFETNFVDLSGSGGLLDQTAGRTSTTIVDWLDERGDEWKAFPNKYLDPSPGGDAESRPGVAARSSGLQLPPAASPRNATTPSRQRLDGSCCPFSQLNLQIPLAASRCR